jgi:hypothetical protein
MEREAELRRELSRKSYPCLVEKANDLCRERLILREAIESFNRARNCLEHTGGVVTTRFCDPPHRGKLTISGRRFKLFFKRGEEEVLAQLGKPGPENAALMLGAEDFEVQFKVDESLELSLKQFLDVLSTCTFVRADIERKLAA